MKLVYLMRFWPVFGGGETVTRTLANEMSGRGHDVTVIYLWDRTNDTEVFVDDRVQAVRLEGISNVYDGKIIKREYNLLKRKLHAQLVRLNPDIVIDQWMPTKVVAQALKGLPAKLVKCHHGSIRHEPVIRKIRQKIFYTLGGEWARWARMYPEYKQDFVYSDKWILLSQGTYKEARILLPWADEKRLGIIPNPLPYEAEPVEISKKSRECLYVGRIIALKRLPYLIDVWKSIEDQVPDWLFRVVGDGDAFEEVKKYAELKQCERIIFEGFKDSQSFFQRASVLVLASAHEGFSMVSVEAMQCGCVPVVTDSFATARYIINSGVNGVLVQDNDREEFANCLKKILLDDSGRERLALQGMKDSQKYSVKNICDEWEKLFADLKCQRGHEIRMRFHFIKNILRHGKI